MKESNSLCLQDTLVSEGWSSEIRLDENSPIYEFVSKETNGFLLQNMIFKYNGDFYITDGLLRGDSGVRPFKCNALYKLNDKFVEHIKGRLDLHVMLGFYDEQGDGAIDALRHGFNCEKFYEGSPVYEEIAKVFNETNKYAIVKKTLSDASFDIDVIIASMIHEAKDKADDELED